jgi:hypothetical protein
MAEEEEDLLRGLWRDQRGRIMCQVKSSGSLTVELKVLIKANSYDITTDVK